MNYRDAPKRVDREELDFDPSEPYVWYCHDCEDYVADADTTDHTPEADDHDGAVRLSRVALGEELG